eukprot:3214590-Amphidinium_carterae.1
MMRAALSCEVIAPGAIAITASMHLFKRNLPDGTIINMAFNVWLAYCVGCLDFTARPSRVTRGMKACSPSTSSLYWAAGSTTSAVLLSRSSSFTPCCKQKDMAGWPLRMLEI